MKQEIRHRRLYAFYNSRILNLLMIVVAVALVAAVYVSSLLVPVVTASVAMAVFIGYSAWLWLSKPKQVIISPRLSAVSGCLLFYYLVISAVRPQSVWWYLAPIACVAIVLLLSIVRPDEKVFVISQ